MADEGPDKAPPTKADKKSTPSPLGSAAAVFPGIAIHGLGHYIAGDNKTAFKLARYQLIGLGMMAASGLYLGLSAGSRYGNEITIPLLVSGSGIFINTWLADIYGTASGGTSRTYLVPPKLSLSAGYGYVRDSIFDFDHFSVTEANLRFGDFSVNPLLWTALTANNQRARLPIRYALNKDHLGQGFELQAALTYHHFGDDGFSNYTGEVGIGFRIDNSRFGAPLAGSYTSLSIGYGLERTHYELDLEPENQALLLGRSAFGIYLPKGGYIESYYDHRRDDFAAGLSPGTANGSGFLGHFGLELRQPLNSRISLRARGELGAAWLFSSGLEFNFGDKQ